MSSNPVQAMSGAADPLVAPQTPTPPSQSLDEKSTLSKKQQEDVLHYLDKCLERCMSPRVTFERQWYVNMSFYFGKQYVDWAPGVNGQVTRLVEPPAPPYRVRLIINKVRRIVRTELTKVTRQVPQFYVVPNTTEESDRMAAMAAEQIAEFELRELKYNKVLRQAVHWALLCGTSFIKTYWDQNSYDPSEVQGKICITPVTVFHIYVPDISEEELEMQDYLIQSVLLNPDAVESTYGVKVDPNAEVRGAQLEQRFLSAMGIKSNSVNKDKVQCYEIWMKPCMKYPQGAFMVWTGKNLLWYQKSWPYAKKEYPFAKIDHIPTGRFYGDSTICDLIPIQKEYNRTHSQIVEIKNKMAKPQWTAQKGSVDANRMTAEPGLVIQFTPGFQEPRPVQPPSLPSYVIDELERLGREMDDLAATGEITKGNVPPGITAASAISYLQEENDNRFAPTVSSIEEATEQVGKWILAFANDYWDETHKVKVVGDNNLQEVNEFTKADIAGNTDFVVETGSAAPRSRAARQAFILELVKMGMIDQQKGLKYLDMVETGELYKESQLDTRQIQRENVAFKNGEQVQINPFDNHIAHFDGHGNWMKTEEFSNLDDQSKQNALEHWQAHKDQIAQDIAAQQSPPVAPDAGNGAISQRPAPTPQPPQPEGA
jgi:hypothetical protein